MGIENEWTSTIDALKAACEARTKLADDLALDVVSLRREVLRLQCENGHLRTVAETAGRLAGVKAV